MKEAEIRFKVELDEQNIPEKIFWAASDAPQEGISETRAMNISLWDHLNKETLKINLWGKEMTTDEMKFFAVDSIGGMAETVMTATGDEYMANEIRVLAQKLMKHVQEEQKKQNNDDSKK